MLDEAGLLDEERTSDFLIPAYSEATGTFSNRRMTSGEGTLWLRECLAAADLDLYDQTKLPTTHSLKTTVHQTWHIYVGGLTGVGSPSGSAERVSIDLR